MIGGVRSQAEVEAIKVKLVKAKRVYDAHIINYERAVSECEECVRGVCARSECTLDSIRVRQSHAQGFNLKHL